MSICRWRPGGVGVSWRELDSGRPRDSRTTRRVFLLSSATTSAGPITQLQTKQEGELLRLAVSRLRAAERLCNPVRCKYRSLSPFLYPYIYLSVDGFLFGLDRRQSRQTSNRVVGAGMV